ncbi:hypothetical protein VHUM_03768 [Vanrija humicola]|uniref:Amidohydrolase 3 domain-containing protein n=1 Tax=Vanrija humicola TaxID=5417 RepID=A0A7D8Z0S0_VANHU|nr:hypothetical protein VHUM_03768 [Vanrija humicola]
MPIANPDINAPLASPQTLFINANVVGWPPGIYAVLVLGGRVAIVSRGLVVPEADMQVVDVCGAWIAPSLVDWHTHFTSAAVHMRRLSLAGYPSAAVALKVVNMALRTPEHDECGTFVAVGMRPGAWADAAILDRGALDALSSKPLVLFFFGNHSLVANSAALGLVGIDAPDGRLFEADAFALSIKLGEMEDAEVVDGWVGELAADIAKLGVTEIVDLEMAANVAPWQRRCAKGFDALRVHIGFYPPHLDDAVARGYKTGAPVPHTNGLVDIGPFKIITDGALSSMTAYCKAPYTNTCNRGALNYTPEEIDALCLKATKTGLRLAVHAIGDEALALVVNALGRHAAAGHPPRAGSTIEHAMLVDAPEVPRMAALGLTASVQPRHLVEDIEIAHARWTGREHMAFPYRTLLDAGVPLRFGSDTPVSPIQPWEAMACAMSREGFGEVFEPQERLSAAQAFAASTWNGRVDIAEGERADLIIVDADPLTLNAEGMRKISVLATMLAGRWTYRAKRP